MLGSDALDTDPVQRKPPWPPPPDADPKRVAKWARGRLRVARTADVRKLVATLTADGDWVLGLEVESPTEQQLAAIEAALAPITADIARLFHRG
jgi:hypothetical protein